MPPKPKLLLNRDYTQNPPVPEVSDTWGLAKVCPQVEFKLLQEEKGRRWHRPKSDPSLGLGLSNEVENFVTETLRTITPDQIRRFIKDAVKVLVRFAQEQKFSFWGDE